jgi:hypothetical protein
LQRLERICQAGSSEHQERSDWRILYVSGYGEERCPEDYDCGDDQGAQLAKPAYTRFLRHRITH